MLSAVGHVEEAAALMENSNFDFPTLVARCSASQPKSADAQKFEDKRRHG